MPEADWIEAGRKLFAGPCDFFFAAARADGLPPVGAPEVAFAGRSNVGKSSLINALTGRNALARTSHTPGRTQELIFFDLNGKATLVDMPGYGYAAVSKEKSASWGKLARDYLPNTTHSAHYIADPGLRRAIDDYLKRERAYVAAAGRELREASPFRRGRAGAGDGGCGDAGGEGGGEGAGGATERQELADEDAGF